MFILFVIVLVVVAGWREGGKGRRLGGGVGGGVERKGIGSVSVGVLCGNVCVCMCVCVCVYVCVRV